jgi:uncharacterized protein (TIGR03435 family)
VCLTAFGQTPAAKPEFEVASIKPSPPLGPGVQVGVHIDGALVRCTSFSLRDYIIMAYDVKIFQVVGPDWVSSERFDISAKVPGGGRDKIREMVQALLADRFELKVHHDSKEFPVYALALGKGGAKMKESPVTAETEGADAKGVNVTAGGGPQGTYVDLGNGSSFSFGNNRLEGKKLTMTQLADMLSRYMDRPVVDQTELKGSYDFTIEVTPEDYRAMLIRSAVAAGVSLPPEALKLMEGVSGDSFFSAIETLGLKMDRRKAPIDVLVIDHMLKTPTEN